MAVTVKTKLLYPEDPVPSFHTHRTERMNSKCQSLESRSWWKPYLLLVARRNNMVTTSLWVAGTIGALKALVFVCDIITYPVYYMLHRPREKLNMSQRVKARQVESDDGSITIRSLQKPGKVHVTVVREGVDTLQKFLHFVVRIYGDKNCLGTRQILSEDDEVQPSGRVFKKYTMGDYKWKSFRMLDEEAASFGRGLRILGQEPLMNVAIFAETRAEWMVAAHGCFKQNIPLVTLYATLGEEAIAHGLNETEASIVITTHNLLPNFKKILPLAPKVKILIYMEDQLKETDTSGFKEGVHIVSFSQVIKDGRPAPIAEVAPKAEDTAIVMYTSGSTGTPKGVILTHKNMMTTMKAFSDAVDIFDDDVFMGFLPLAHVFELLTECVCLVYGVSIGYSTPLTMMDTSSKIKKGSSGDATVLKPTLLTSVPLILDRIRKGVNDRVSKSSGLQRELFRFAFEYRRAWTRRGFNTPLVNKLVFGKTRQLLGGRIRLVLCGGAPLAQDTHEFVKVCLCVDLTPGYGLTETCSAATVLDRYDMSAGRVGNPTTVTDVRLVDWAEGNYTVKDKPYPRGEVIIGGDHVSPGYYKLPDRTGEDFFKDTGRQWFKSGDIAELHPDGVLTIIDRKKDLVKLQLGEYVSLGKVEMELKTSPLVENVCVYGDSSKEYTVALVVPSAGPLAELAAAEGIPALSFEQLCERPDVERAVLRELQDHARRSKLEKFEIPEAIKLCSEVWSPDMGLVTAAFKLRRKMIQDRYQHEINRMYAS